jgi:hypothetical protein
VPAAAVIPAPIAYTKVVAVKKLVVEIVSRGVGLPIVVRQARLRGFSPVRVHRRGRRRCASVFVVPTGPRGCLL